MKQRAKQLFQAHKILQAFVVTMTIAVVFHLSAIFITAFIKRDITYINPMEFLGLAAVFPNYRESAAAAVIGWLVIAGVFGTVLYLSVHYNVYLSLIKESKVGKRFTKKKPGDAFMPTHILNKEHTSQAPNSELPILSTSITGSNET